MDFGALPPEVNSGRMYAGPGAESMLAAASGWDGLATQLRSAATSYVSTLAGLTANWQGPSSAAMAAAAGPFVAWLNTTAAQAEETAVGARAAVAAYDTAFAATVPPPVIEANRTALAALTATNIVGQNTAAIAANEAQYAGMWAQDAAAMYGYAGQSAAASRVPTFSPPPRSTDPDGSAVQSAAVAQSAATSAGHGSQSALTHLTSSLQSLAGPAAPNSSTDVNSAISLFIRNVLNPFGSLSPIEKGAEFFELPATAALPARNALTSSTLGFALATRGFNTGELPVPIVPGVPFPPVADTASAVSAGVSRAGLVGALSVPPTWTVATPSVRLAAAALQGVGSAGAPTVAVLGEGGLFGEMALASAAGSIIGGTAFRQGRAADPDTKDSAAECKPDEPRDNDSKTSEKLQRVLADLSQNPESVQHWHTDKAHLDGLLEQLSMKPGVHAVHVSTRHKPNPASRQPRWG
ncbi:PPE family protein [Mycobacterium sp.]|uniref:PPE family protein n=1 Tax=Mycobacterium sp. TaxID=1785 RepID=UPI0031DF88A4